MILKKQKKKFRTGQVMIETLVTISVVMIGLLGVLVLVSRSIAFNYDASEQFVATYLASEGIEVVKGVIDENYAANVTWDEGISNGQYQVNYKDDSLGSSISGFENAQPLNFDSVTGIYDYISGAPTPFKRLVGISKIDNGGIGVSNEIIVVSTVEWLSRGATKKVTLEDHFFDWRKE
ncbi:MAG: hypothetical protein AAB432_02615 [Patescibacteria group bacterium]